MPYFALPNNMTARKSRVEGWRGGGGFQAHLPWPRTLYHASHSRPQEHRRKAQVFIVSEAETRPKVEVCFVSSGVVVSSMSMSVRLVV